jgi:hypothetical protein
MFISAVRPRALLSQEHLLSLVVLLTTTCGGCSERPAPTSKDDADNRHTDAVSVETTPGGLSNRTASSTEIASKAQSDSASVVEPATEPDPLYRISGDKPQLNPQRLAAAGIHVLESRRLILLTDRDPETVRDLPVLADLFFAYLERACGRLRPSRSGADFQAIGCLMSDFELFRTMGLVPGPVVEMRHGQQLGYRFWMRDQADDYYRRHLLLHEFAHVYMTCDAGLSDIPEGWFMEGAAEVFATHATTAGETRFGLLPRQFDGFEGWGRISEIRRRRVDQVATDFALQTIPTIDEVRFPTGGPASDETRYAWWWALSWMLCNHPDYADDWTSLCRCRGAEEFQQQADDMASRLGQKLSVDWLLFAESLCERFDHRRSFPQHRGSAEPADAELTLLADRSWQDTGWDLTADLPVTIVCSGRSVIEETTAPWISEPGGVTLEYNQGRPLGEVIAILVDSEGGWISRRIAVGHGVTMTTPRPARLWLQINDSAGARTGNSGGYHVAIQRQSTSRQSD